MNTSDKRYIKRLFEEWNITPEELAEIVVERPSLRGIIEGYIAERKLMELLSRNSMVKLIGKYDNHDRRKRGDMFVVYKGETIGIEVKSLQTGSIRRVGSTWYGKFQCDASDSRKVKLPTGEEIITTCRLVNDFDVVAVSLFGFFRKWEFAFALSEELPRTTYRGYKPEQRKYLLATTIEITYPLRSPFTSDPFILFDKIVQKRRSARS
jgi:hypothetical protein